MVVVCASLTCDQSSFLSASCDGSQPPCEIHASVVTCARGVSGENCASVTCVSCERSARRLSVSCERSARRLSVSGGCGEEEEGRGSR